MKRPFRRVAFLCACALASSIGVSRAANQFSESFTTTTYKDAANTTADWNTGAGELRLFPFAPTLRGSYNTTGTAISVAVDGNLAFVADGSSGLHIFDVADPASPALVGTYSTSSSVRDVVVAGDLAFVADYSDGLQIINISNPASPTLVGGYNPGGFTPALTVDGNLAFLVQEFVGLVIINISNPATPTLVGYYFASGVPRDVFVAGDLAFVTEGSSGLEIVDISDPANAAPVGGYDTPGDARGVAITGNLALIADDTAGGLQIIDITDPANPTFVASYDTPGDARAVAVTGDLACVADGASGGLQVVDITNPASPGLIGSYDTPGIASGIALSGNLALVADDAAGGLQIVTITSRATPALAGQISEMYFANYTGSVAVSGDLAFVGITNGLEIVDISDSSNPTLVSHQPISWIAEDVAVSGDLALVASSSLNYVNGSLEIVDISNPASPAIIGTYGPYFAPQGRMAVAGDLVYLTSAGEFYVVDISNPASPSLVSDTNFGPGMGVAVTGDIAVAVGTNNLLTIDITNPGSPTLITSVLVPSTFDIAVTGDLAFVATGPGLRIFDISNPASPSLLGTYPGPDFNVTVAGDLAFVSEIGGGLKMLDVSNPASPALVGAYPLGFASGVAVAGEFAYATDVGELSLDVIQVYQHEVDASRNVGRSIAVDGGTDTILRARLSTTQTAGVSWEVSADDGAAWQPISPDNTWNVFSFPGSDLQWRSTHAWTSLGLNPAVSDLNLEWLYDYAVIDAITDIPNDQGKQVRVEWTRSGHDFVGDPTQIVEYAIYRKIDPNLGSLAVPPTAQVLEGLSAAARENAIQMLAAGWDFVTTVPVLAEDYYAVVVPTLKDSTIVSGQYETTFRVTALTATPGVFFHSPPDSGYSVDNLAPSVPANLTIAYNTGSGNTLSWDISPDSDFRYFRVYRSADPNFTPSTGTLVHSTTANGWTDPDNHGSGVYYRVTATDFSGNESAAANGGTITAAGGTPLPARFALYPNVPNPFNPSTTIRYDVPEQGVAVRLGIYDVSGRLVRTLVDARQSAGEKSVAWDGRDHNGQPVSSGIYFYRIAAGGFRETRKMVLLK